MKIFATTLAMILWAATAAQADMSCSRDAPAEIICRGDRGEVWRGTLDSRQNPQWEEMSKGYKISSSTNEYGEKRFRASHGPDWRRETNGYGQIEWRSTAGHTVTLIEQSGNRRVYTSNPVDKLICTTNHFNDTTCRSPLRNSAWPLPQLIAVW